MLEFILSLKSYKAKRLLTNKVIICHIGLISFLDNQRSGKRPKMWFYFFFDGFAVKEKYPPPFRAEEYY